MLHQLMHRACIAFDLSILKSENLQEQRDDCIVLSIIEWVHKRLFLSPVLGTLDLYPFVSQCRSQWLSSPRRVGFSALEPV